MKFVLLLSIALITTTVVVAQPPAGYYSTAATGSCATLKTTLKTIITNGNSPQSYGSLWTQYQLSDIKPREVGSGSTNVIWDIYSDNPTGVDPYNFTPSTNQCGNYNSEADCYNREHSVPQSWFSGNTGVAGPTTDYLHIFPTDGYVNGKRANFIYGEVASASYTSLNGSKLGTSSVAGFTGSVFEPINEYKGDIARAFLYFVTRYENDIPTWSSNAEAAQSFDNSTFPSVKINYLKLMIKWHNQDPVSQKEIDRNNAAYTYQGNRNPFIDSPQYVNRVWSYTCPGLSTLPVNIVFFSGKLQNNKVLLNWEAENEINFNRYDVERSVNGTNYLLIGSIKSAGIKNYSYTDVADNIKGRRVYYRLKKIDNDGNFSYSEVFTLQIPLNIKFTVYPNPAQGFVSLQVNNNNNGKVTVQLTDITGKMVVNSVCTLTNGLITIPLKQLNAGTFTIKLIEQNESYLQKFVVIK
jgi:endonuclease I